MGWRITVKAGRAHMKNKRKTGKKKGGGLGDQFTRLEQEVLRAVNPKPNNPTTPGLEKLLLSTRHKNLPQQALASTQAAEPPTTAAAQEPSSESVPLSQGPAIAVAAAAAAAAEHPYSCDTQPIVIHKGLDQNHTKIVNKPDEPFRIPRDDMDRPFIGNACLYYAINNLENNFSSDPNNIVTLLNNFAETKLIDKTNPQYWNVILDTPDKSIFEGIFEKYKNIVFATYNSFLNTTTFTETYCTQIISRRQINPNSTSDTYEWTPLTSLQEHIVDIEPDKQIPWINGELWIIALVQTSTATRNEDILLEYDRPGHLIAIKIKPNEIEIADSINIHDAIFSRFPIDRRNDPKVKQIITDLCATRPISGTTTLGQKILDERAAELQSISQTPNPTFTRPDVFEHKEGDTPNASGATSGIPVPNPASAMVQDKTSPTLTAAPAAAAATAAQSAQGSLSNVVVPSQAPVAPLSAIEQFSISNQPSTAMVPYTKPITGLITSTNDDDFRMSFRDKNPNRTIHIKITTVRDDNDNENDMYNVTVTDIDNTPEAVMPLVASTKKSTKELPILTPNNEKKMLTLLNKYKKILILKAQIQNKQIQNKQIQNKQKPKQELILLNTSLNTQKQQFEKEKKLLQKNKTQKHILDVLQAKQIEFNEQTKANQDSRNTRNSTDKLYDELVKTLSKIEDNIGANSIAKQKQIIDNILQQLSALALNNNEKAKKYLFIYNKFNKKYKKVMTRFHILKDTLLKFDGIAITYQNFLETKKIPYNNRLILSDIVRTCLTNLDNTFKTANDNIRNEISILLGKPNTITINDLKTLFGNMTMLENVITYIIERLLPFYNSIKKYKKLIMVDPSINKLIDIITNPMINKILNTPSK